MTLRPAADRTLWIEIDDNGTGFAPQSPAHDGLGLKIMRHRAASFGGRVEHHTSPLGGAQVRCFVPGVVWTGVSEFPSVPASDASRPRRSTGVNRVLLADDHPVFRSGLAALLAQEADLAVCGEVARLDDLAAICARENPHVLVCDLLFAETLALPALSRLHSAQPEMRIVVVSMFPESAYGEPARAAGAVAYVSKQSSPAALLAAVRRAALAL